MRIVSTLDIHSYGRDTPNLRTAVDNLARFVQHGGTVVYGTDLGNGPIPEGLHVGEVMHLVSAGLRADQILQAVTAGPIRVGAPADLVGLGGDPRVNLAAFSKVRFVMRGGRIARND